MEIDQSSLITGIIIGAVAAFPLGILAGWIIHDLLSTKATTGEQFGSINIVRDDKGLPISYEILPIGQLFKQ